MSRPARRQTVRVQTVWETLGVRPGAQPIEIKRAFAAGVRAAHPDTGADPAAAASRLAELIEARDIAVQLSGLRRSPALDLPPGPGRWAPVAHRPVSTVATGRPSYAGRTEDGRAGGPYPRAAHYRAGAVRPEDLRRRPATWERTLLDLTRRARRLERVVRAAAGRSPAGRHLA